MKVIQTGRKYCGKKEKLLVTSNFSFSHSVFKRVVSQGHQNVSLCGNGLTLHQMTKIIDMSIFKAFADNKNKCNTKTDWLLVVLGLTQL